MSSTDLFFDAIKHSLTGLDKGGDPYSLGFDCGKNGPNTTNCSFSIFSSKEATRAWERGKRVAEAEKATSVPSGNEEQPAALGNQNSELGLRGGAR